MNNLGNLLAAIIFVCIIVMFNWAEERKTPDLFVSQEWNSVVVEKSEVIGTYFLYCMRVGGEVKQVVVYEIVYLKYAVGDTVK